MKKDKFISIMQERVREQVAISDVPFTKVFLFVSRIFGESPWRIFIPIAIVCTGILQLVGKTAFDNTILWLFGSL